mmetsp:Transcript_7416/g.10913  ORF Transcript_7416/g.10913 Transcript_7416/m.10913 type:complete len:147 (+) Transcript_7416:505-945(+)
MLKRNPRAQRRRRKITKRRREARRSKQSLLSLYYGAINSAYRTSFAELSYPLLFYNFSHAREISGHGFIDRPETSRMLCIDSFSCDQVTNHEETQISMEDLLLNNDYKFKQLFGTLLTLLSPWSLLCGAYLVMRVYRLLNEPENKE